MQAMIALAFLILAPAMCQDITVSDPEALQAQIESLRPTTLVWREIAWIDCPLEALKLSREKRKPILAWVFLGNPKDERC